MNTLLDIMTFNRERASRHIGASDRGWSMAGLAVVVTFILLLLSARAGSAPAGSITDTTDHVGHQDAFPVGVSYAFSSK